MTFLFSTQFIGMLLLILGLLLFGALTGINLIGCMASTRSSLNENNLDFIQLVIPNGKLLENFEKFAKKCIDKRLITTEENRKLMELRDFLLPMLMNGQVTVK